MKNRKNSKRILLSNYKYIYIFVLFLFYEFQKKAPINPRSYIRNLNINTIIILSCYLITILREKNSFSNQI